MPRARLYTIGHSTRSFDELVDVLRAWEVRVLVDIRHITRSRTNPQFNADTLTRQLPRAGIEYVHIPELGGRRSRAKEVDPMRNAGWTNASFKNYADYAETDAFANGLDQLVERAVRKTCAIMCAEAVWWRCHRRIIADYLIAAGETVLHILGPGRIEPAHITPAAKSGPPGILTYPANR